MDIGVPPLLGAADAIWDIGGVVSCISNEGLHHNIGSGVNTSPFNGWHSVDRFKSEENKRVEHVISKMHFKTDKKKCNYRD